jgi:hypothetical protein
MTPDRIAYWTAKFKEMNGAEPQIDSIGYDQVHSILYEKQLTGFLQCAEVADEAMRDAAVAKIVRGMLGKYDSVVVHDYDIDDAAIDAAIKTEAGNG